MTQTKCPYCGTMLENVCPKCRAYRVTDETHDLPLSKQPYYNPEIHKKPKKMKLKKIFEPFNRRDILEKHELTIHDRPDDKPEDNPFKK